MPTDLVMVARDPGMTSTLLVHALPLTANGYGRHLTICGEQFVGQAAEGTAATVTCADCSLELKRTDQ